MESARRRIVTPVHARVALAVMLVAALALSPARAAGRDLELVRQSAAFAHVIY
jgi:hypothetical protein